MRMIFATCTVLLLVTGATAKEYHVSAHGNDQQPGSADKPLQTISAAASLAQPGDAITVHEGTYRERVTPPRGGTSDDHRIVYQAAEGEKVVIKGSEVVSDWQHVQAGVWKVSVPNTLFGQYNPYEDLISGDWFSAQGRVLHTGEVYLNGKSLYEASTLQEVLESKPMAQASDKEGSTYTWYCETDDTHTHIWANFREHNPNESLVEINVRDACFYPDRPGINYITVRGFRMCQAATQWAAPTAEQIGLIGTHWSKGWIIEDNVISDSKCTGITLGKDRASGHNDLGTAEGYNEVIERALKNGWSKERIGSHIVRNNTIFNCEEAGICGSMGAAFSQVTGNHIYNIWVKRLFGGAEMAAVKFHGPIDVLIKGNRIHHAGYHAFWMDWMTQGTRITGNLCYDNQRDLHSEVNHGPYLVDNNLFLSPGGLRNRSQNGAYVHNLVAGKNECWPGARETPYHHPHSTQVAGLAENNLGYYRYYNNIFVGDGSDNGGYSERRTFKDEIVKQSYGLFHFDDVEPAFAVFGNVYVKGAKGSRYDTDQIEHSSFDPGIQLLENGEQVYLYINLDPAWKDVSRKLVTTPLLGKAERVNARYENPDGTDLTVDTDYLGNSRDPDNPSPGPFEKLEAGPCLLRVW